MQTVARIVQLFGGLARLASASIRLDVGGFMPLCIEYIGTGPRGLPMLSVCHYYEQNGDLLSDPDLTFEIDGDRWLPVSFQQDGLGLYHEVVSLTDDGPSVDKGLERQLLQFAALWDRNLAAQGFLAEAQRRTGQSLGDGVKP